MKITYGDKTIQREEAIKVSELLKEEIEKSEYKVVACRVNNQVRDLDYILTKDCVISLIDITTRPGIRIYSRGVMFVMCMAFSEVYPDALLTVNYQLSNAMFCEIDNMQVTEEMMEKVKEKMLEIIHKELPITYKELTREEAEEFYKKERTLKGIVQLEEKQVENISLYFCEDYYNYLYGKMPTNTKDLDVFDLMKYRDGFLVRYPSRENPKELHPYKDSKRLIATLDEYEDIYKLVNINTLYKLNQKIRKGDTGECIMLGESLHEKKIAGIADKIAKNKQVKMVLIAGPSSSGKTTFAKRLGMQLKLNGIDPFTISVDNYFVERENTPKNNKGEYDFECLEAIDLKLFNDHLTRLLKGEELVLPTFNFAVGHKQYNTPKVKLRKDQVLVIEGIHCLNDRLTQAIPREQKYKIYISALTVLNVDYYNRISTTDTRLIRRIVRDNQFRNYTALHTLNMWDSVNEGEEKHIYPFQEEADSMFNSSLIYELGVLRDYALPLLEKIEDTNEQYGEAERLRKLLYGFEPISTKDVPTYSILREFIGGSVFE